MAIDQSVGTTNIRSNFYDKVVKGFAEATYKFKQVVTVVPTSAWTNFFYRESATALASPAGNNIKAIPRGGNFPQAIVEWERVSSDIEKYGLEDNIHWEDILADDIDVQARTLFRISEGVTKRVDDTIFIGLGGTGIISGISSFSVVGSSWSASSAAIIDNLMRARQLIAENNYPTDNLALLISPRDHRSIVRYLTDKGAQFPSISTEAASNGNAGNLAGIDIIVSNSVTASNALVVVKKRCATWRELVPLRTTTTEDPYKSVRIRAVEEGVLQLTDPKAVVLIIGTQDTLA